MPTIEERDVDFTIINSQSIFDGHVFQIRRDRLKMPNDKISELDIVVHADSVCMLPIDENKNIWFVRQYRHPAQREILELPAGVLEKDEKPDECAQREIREEIGMEAGKIINLGGFYLAPGYSTEFMYVYIMLDLSANPLQPDENEFLRVERIPKENVFDLIEKGKILDAKSIAAIAMANKVQF